MELFDFIDVLFSKKKYPQVPDSVKKKHFFMTHRFLSIKFPEQANFYNKVQINQVAVLDFWHKWLSSRYSKKPGWIYTKSTKKKKVDDKMAKKLGKIKTTTVNYFMKVKELCKDDYDFMIEIFPEEILAELKKVEKFMTENGVKF